MSNHPWYILGAGAIGCLWAGYWKQSGTDVILITPTARTTSTLEITNQHEKKQLAIQSITMDELAASDTIINKLFISTKAQHTLAAVAAIKNNIAAQASILVMQNGMAIKKLPALLPTQTLLAGITTDGAYRTGQLSVVHAGHGETYIGGDKALLQCLPTQYLSIKTCNDIEVRQWQKLGINCAINGLTAIYQCRNGELLDKPEAMQRIQAICDEFLHIAEHLGISTHLSSLNQQVRETLHTTANNYSSMYQDIAKGQTTEIDFLNGYLCDLATELSIACPQNQSIVRAVKALQQPLLTGGNS